MLKRCKLSGVSFRQCSLSQSQDSNVLSYSKHKIAKNFPGCCPWTPLGRAYSAVPDSSAAQWFFSLLHLSKNWHPPKIAEYGTTVRFISWVVLTIFVILPTLLFCLSLHVTSHLQIYFSLLHIWPNKSA